MSNSVQPNRRTGDNVPTTSLADPLRGRDAFARVARNEDEMRILSGLLCGVAAIVTLAGCAYRSDYSDRYGAYDGYNGGPYAGYDGYYDGYYGPYGGGYWAADGYFYYMDDHHNYRRDDSHHFRHESFAGGNPIHAEHRHNSEHDGRHDDDSQEYDRH
jgi:hypothetical protein